MGYLVARRRLGDNSVYGLQDFELVEATQSRYAHKVTYCFYAELWKKQGRPDIGYQIHCRTDMAWWNHPAWNLEVQFEHRKHSCRVMITVCLSNPCQAKNKMLDELRILCAHIPKNELVAAECQNLTGGCPDAEGVAICQTLDYFDAGAT